MDDLVCHVELRPDGVILVRVPPSDPCLFGSLPDAVFSFRAGDPQYSFWRARWYLQASESAESAALTAGGL